jgi:hypothetical protein
MTQTKNIVSRWSNLRRRITLAALATVVAFATLRPTGALQAQQKPKAKPAADAAPLSSDREEIRGRITKYAESLDGADAVLASQVLVELAGGVFHQTGRLGAWVRANQARSLPMSDGTNLLRAHADRSRCGDPRSRRLRVG